MKRKPPDFEAVRIAVVNSFAEGESREEARAALSEWGEAALPHLERLAREMDDERPEARVRGRPRPPRGQRLSGHALVYAIDQIPSERAARLMLEILEGKTGVSPEHVLLLMPAMVYMRGSPPAQHYPEERARVELVKLPGFKAAVLTFTAGSFLEQSAVAMAAAAFGWVDLVPRLLGMLEHENFSLREEAAAALRRLTGEAANPRRPAIAFPREELREDLFRRRTEEVEPTRRRRRMGASGATLHSGCPDLWTIAVPDHATQLVSLVSRRFGREATHAVARDPAGTDLWSYEPPNGRIKSAARLRDESGDYGIALGCGGESSLVAVGPSGELLWGLRNLYVLYELRSHPALPCWLLYVGGKCRLIRHDRTGADSLEMWPFGTDEAELATYAGSAALFPNEEGDPSFVVAGTGSRPAISRFDIGKARRWTATLSGRPSDLAMLERDGGERLFAVATDPGDLVVFDERGTLRWKTRLPGARDDDTLRVSDIEWVEDAGSWRLDVRLSTGTFRYDLMP